jgi:Domain of unknown function (DUF1707)
MSQPPDVRASDREREETAELLRRHAAEGRLELDERLSTAYAARTHGELAGLTADLPALGPEATPPQRRSIPRELWPAVVRFATVNVVCIAVWLFTGADGDFWPRWVLLVSAVVLVGRVVASLRDDEMG